MSVNVRNSGKTRMDLVRCTRLASSGGLGARNGTNRQSQKNCHKYFLQSVCRNKQGHVKMLLISTWTRSMQMHVLQLFLFTFMYKLGV